MGRRYQSCLVFVSVLVLLASSPLAAFDTAGVAYAQREDRARERREQNRESERKSERQSDAEAQQQSQAEIQRRVDEAKQLVQTEARRAEDARQKQQEEVRRLQAETQRNTDAPQRQQEEARQRAQAETQRRIEEARQQAQSETQRAQAQAETQRAQAETKRRIEEAQQRQQEEARQRAQAESQRVQAESQQRAQTEAARWQAEAQQRAQAENQARLQEEARQRILAEAQRQQAEAQQRISAEQQSRQQENARQRMLAEAQRRQDEERLRAQAQWRPQVEAPWYEVGRPPGPPPPLIIASQPPNVGPLAPLSPQDPLTAQIGGPPPSSGGWNVVSRPAPWAQPLPIVGAGLPQPPAPLPADLRFSPPGIAQQVAGPGAGLPQPVLSGIATDPYGPLSYPPVPYPLGLSAPYPPGYAAGNPYNQVYLNGVWYRPWEVPRQYGGPAGSSYPYAASPGSLYASGYPGSTQAYALEQLNGSILPYVPSYPFGITAPYTPTYTEGKSPYDRVYINGVWYRPWEVPRQYGGPAGNSSLYSFGDVYPYTPGPVYSSPLGSDPYTPGSAYPVIPSGPYPSSPSPTYPYSLSPAYPYSPSPTYPYASGSVYPRVPVTSYPYTASDLSLPPPPFADAVNRPNAFGRYPLPPMPMGILGLPSVPLAPPGRMAFPTDVALDLSWPGGIALPADPMLGLPPAGRMAFPTALGPGGPWVQLPPVVGAVIPQPPAAVPADLRFLPPAVAQHVLGPWAGLPQPALSGIAIDPYRGPVPYPPVPYPLGLSAPYPPGYAAGDPYPQVDVNGVWYRPWEVPRQYGGPAGSSFSSIPGPGPLYASGYPGSTQAYALEHLNGSILPYVPSYPFGISAPYTPTYIEGKSPYDRVYINGVWYRPWEVPRQYGGPAGNSSPYSVGDVYPYNPGPVYPVPPGSDRYISGKAYPSSPSTFYPSTASDLTPRVTVNIYPSTVSELSPRVTVNVYPSTASDLSLRPQSFVDPITRPIAFERYPLPPLAMVILGLPSAPLAPAGRMAFPADVALDISSQGIAFVADPALAVSLPGRMAFPADPALGLPPAGSVVFPADPVLGVPLPGRIGFPANPALGLAPAGRVAFPADPALGLPPALGPLPWPRPPVPNAAVSPFVSGPPPSQPFAPGRPAVLAPEGRALAAPPVGIDRLPPLRDVGLAGSLPARPNLAVGTTGQPPVASQSLVAGESAPGSPAGPVTSVQAYLAAARTSSIDQPARTELELAVAGIGVGQPPALAAVSTLPSTGTLGPAVASPLGALLSLLALIAGLGMWSVGRRRRD